jgi:hypothetical protein
MNSISISQTCIPVAPLSVQGLSLSYHFEGLLKNVAYSFSIGPVLNQLTEDD